MADYIEEAFAKAIKANATLSQAEYLGKNKIFFVEAPQGIKEPYAVISRILGDDRPLTICEKYAGSPTLQINVITKGVQSGKISNLKICEEILNQYQYFKGVMESITIRRTKITNQGVRKDPDYPDIYIGTVEIEVEYLK